MLIFDCGIVLTKWKLLRYPHPSLQPPLNRLALYPSILLETDQQCHLSLTTQDDGKELVVTRVMSPINQP